jgi:hypothetical protein
MVDCSWLQRSQFHELCSTSSYFDEVHSLSALHSCSYCFGCTVIGTAFSRLRAMRGQRKPTRPAPASCQNACHGSPCDEALAPRKQRDIIESDARMVGALFSLQKSMLFSPAIRPIPPFRNLGGYEQRIPFSAL